MASEFVEESTTRVSTNDRRLRLPSVEIVVIDGVAKGSRVRLSTGMARVGSSSSNEVVIPERSVSRLHCEITVRPSGVTLRDTGSTNGTFVAGVRVRDADLPPGALIVVGASTLRVDVDSGPTFLELSSKTNLGDLYGASAVMRALFAMIERVAPTESTILLRGETGTGKEVAARTIHSLSARASKPLVPVDCGAVPEHLFESELFGHKRGAFTGATSDRRGVFEEADGGTLFLDEIGELPISLQPKLLRALETRTIRPVGENIARPIDVRVIAATNRALERSVNDGTFREDLYHRLAVVELTLPPLRERPEDIAPLAQRFYETLAPTDHMSTRVLPSRFIEQLAARGFPGNVRELRNAVERAISLGLIEDRDQGAPPPLALSRPDVSDLVPLDLPLKEARDAWMQSFEMIYARAMLERTGGNITRAAELAGVSRRFLQRLLARLGEPPEKMPP